MKENVDSIFWKGQSLEIVTANRKNYFTEVIQHDLVIMIKQPLNQKNGPLTIENGMRVAVYFYDDQKELYTFNTNIYQLKNNACLIDKPASGSIKKAQRRRFFRVQVAVQMDLRIQSKTKPEASDEWNLPTYDISGGGLSFLTHQKIVTEGEKVEGTLYLAENDNVTENDDVTRMEFKGNIVNVLKLGERVYKTAIEFVDMKDSERTEIIRFCMSKQIELRKALRRTMNE